MSKRKLLLADDSITIQKVVNLTFADEGIEVISVGDGDSAMQKIAEAAPDLVLADVNMPGMNGYQICESIKQNAATRSIPVVLLVGSFEPFDEAEAYRVGADDYLTKPFQSIRQLVSKVSDLLEGANGASSISAAAETVAAAASNSDTETTDFYTVDAYSTNNDNANVNNANTASLRDAEIDDEMIQTDQVGSLPVDETQKFMSPQPEQTVETSTNQPVYADFEPKFNSAAVAGAQEDFGKTKRSSDEIFQLFPEENNLEPGRASVYDFGGKTTGAGRSTTENEIFSLDEDLEIGNVSGQNSASPQSQKNFTTDSEIIFDEVPPAASSSSSSVIFDETDLLELPSVKPKTASKKSPVSEIGAVENVEDATAKAGEKSGKASERVNQFSKLSPEMIEAIAQKVAEKISDKAIREIAWELVPQLTASIIKKMEQDKSKE